MHAHLGRVCTHAGHTRGTEIERAASVAHPQGTSKAPTCWHCRTDLPQYQPTQQRPTISPAVAPTIPARAVPPRDAKDRKPVCPSAAVSANSQQISATVAGGPEQPDRCRAAEQRKRCQFAEITVVAHLAALNSVMEQLSSGTANRRGHFLASVPGCARDRSG